MKKIEKMQIQIYLIIILIAGLYLGCAILNIIQTILLKLDPVILIVGFCYLIYKVLTKEG